MIHWSRSALATLRHIYTTIAAEQPAAAERVLEALRANASVLAAHPGLGLATKREGVYRFPVPQTKYILVYRLTNDGITVILIFQGAQD